MDGRTRARIGLALTTAVGVAAALLATPAAGDDAGPTPDPTGVAWAPCPPDLLVTTPLQCGTVTVPLDYDEPAGAQIEIWVSRLAAADPEERRGVLLTNPGGPGHSGLSQPADLATRGIATSVLDAYDVIGMDPRGVGRSAPVSCGFTSDQEYWGNVPPFAPDAAAVARHAEVSKGVAAQCADQDDEGRLAHISTANAARDMDRIRVALGEEKISYFGASYGTALGAAYATLFPERTDRVVLDSNLGGPALDRDAQRRFAPGLEDRFGDFARWAAQRHPTYGLGRTPREVRANFLALAERLDRSPVAGIDGATFRFFMFSATYADSSFTMIAPLWQSLADGDARAAARNAATLETARPEQARAGSPVPHDNTLSAYLAYVCNDTDWPEDVATYQRDVAADRARYPLYGGAAANINPCAFWADPAEAPLVIDDEGPRNVLVLQNLRDPGTPHRGGELARAAFGDRARLVSVDAGGHGVYVYGGNACAQNTATTFLLTGALPRTDVRCRADA